MSSKRLQKVEQIEKNRFAERKQSNGEGKTGKTDKKCMLKGAPLLIFREEPDPVSSVEGVKNW